jgi:PAS domain S-box-containing protein
MRRTLNKHHLFTGIRERIIVYFGILSLIVSGGLFYGVLYGVPRFGIEGVFALKESEAVRALESAADAKKQSVTGWLNERRTDVSIAANSRAFAAAAGTLATGRGNRHFAGIPARQYLCDQLRTIKETLPAIYDKLVVVSADGKTIASSASEEIGTRYPFPDFVRGAFAVGATEQIGTVSDSKHPLILVSRQIAVRDSDGEETGEVAAVIVAQARLQQSLESFASLPGTAPANGTHMILVGSQGELLASVPLLPEGSFKKDPIAVRLALRAMSRTESSLMETLENRKKLIAAYRFVPIGASDGWGIAIALDHEQAFAPLTATMVHTVIFGLCIILAALMLVGWGAGRIAEPIRSLRRSVCALEAGDFAVRAGTDGRGGAEIGELAVAFNSMAQRMEHWHLELERQVADRTRELRSEKDTAQRYLDVAGVMLIYLDRDGRIGMINSTGASLLGCSEQELIGLNWFDHFLPEGRVPEIKEVFATLMRGDAQVLEFFENPVLTRAKEERLFSWHNILLHGEDGTIQGVLSSGEDITLRRRAELERAELERQLLHTQKLESLGVLAGGIAHDFNNLLMAIGGNLELARHVLVADGAATKFIDNAFLASQRATDLTRQMLAYSGKGGYCVKIVDLNQLVRENADLFKASIAKGVIITAQLAPELPPLAADPGQMQQVIMNLITNAAEAIGDGVGAISVVTGIATIDAATLAKSRLEEQPVPGKYIFIEVADNGCGMGTDTLQRLFDPFFTTKFTGRGLGLSAVLGIIRGHGGAIFVDSVPGVGSTFKVLFPVSVGSAGKSDASHGMAGHARKPSASETVLIVDDEDMVRMVCCEMVQGLGYKTMDASDGIAAVDMFRAHAEEISLVIMDLSMPQMDGLAASAEIRRIRPGVHVILSSGYSEEEAARNLESHQGTSFIQKPYDLESLRQTLENFPPQ